MSDGGARPVAGLSAKTRLSTPATLIDLAGEAAVGLHIRRELGWVRFAKFAPAIDCVLYLFGLTAR